MLTFVNIKFVTFFKHLIDYLLTFVNICFHLVMFVNILPQLECLLNEVGCSEGPSYFL